MPLRLPGKFAKERKKLAWILIAVYLVAPWININGKHLLQIDLSSHTYWFFFRVWRQTDAIFFLAIPILLLLTLFFTTAVKGRLWCGYACPQTVFLDWVIRPIEEFFEGTAYNRMAALKKKMTAKRLRAKILKHITYLCIAAVVGNTALMYFFGPQEILSWMGASPRHHPIQFAAMLVISLVFYVDFSWFREQFCSFVCPYARFQAILLDESSPVVRYHADRGEPRGKPLKKQSGQSTHSDTKLPKGRDKGDCIDCGLCTRVCPTGIDIREGLQLECIQCFRCVDACNKVMISLRRPPRLIDFSSTQAAAKKSRGRLKLYITLYVLIIGALIFGLTSRPDITISILRQQSSSVVQYFDGEKGNLFTAKIVNTSDKPIAISLQSARPDVNVLCGPCQGRIEPYETKRASVVVKFPAEMQADQVELVFKFGDRNSSVLLPLIH